MKYVTFQEYQAAKQEIIGGVECVEESAMKVGGVISKQYGTENNGTFFEVNDNGIVEFWSTKHSISRYYDARVSKPKAEMNIYKIEIVSESNRKVIGYAANVDDYQAAKSVGLTNLKQESYRNNGGKDEWTYRASNAIGCLVAVTKM